MKTKKYLSKNKDYFTKLSLTISLILITGAMVLSYIMLKNISERRSMEVNTSLVINKLMTIKIEVIDAGMGVRGYKLSGDNSYLSAYKKFLDTYPVYSTELKNLLAENKIQIHNLDSLDKMMRVRLQYLELSISSEHKYNSFEFIKLLKESNDSQEKINQQIQAMIDEEKKCLAEQSAASSDIISNLIYIIFISSIAAFVILMIFYFTVRKRTEERDLQRTESEKVKIRTEAILNNLGEAVISTNTDSKIIYVNSAAEKITGFNRDEILGKHFDEVITLIDESSNKTIKNLIEQVINEQLVEWHNSMLIFSKSGLQIPVDKTSTVIEQNGQVKGIAMILRDISERKKSYQQLKESKERFQMLVENINDLITEISAETKILYASPNHKEILGYEISELVGKYAIDLIHPDDRNLIYEELPNVTGKAVYRFKHKELGWRWLESTSNHVIDKSGETNLVVISRDITDKLKAEKALQESEELFRGTFEQAAVGIANVGLDGRWLKVNKKLCDIVGYTKEELMKLTFQEITHPDDLKVDIEALKRLKAGDTVIYTTEKRYIRKDKSVVWINLTVSIIYYPDGSPNFFVTIVDDISVRRIAEEKLYVMSKAVEHSSHSILLTDPYGNIEYVNPKFEEISGYSSNEVIGKNPRLLKSGLTPVETFKELWETIISGKEWKGEIINKKKNGELYWDEVAVSPVMNENNEITHYVAVQLDISLRKEAEETIRNGKKQIEVLYDASKNLGSTLELGKVYENVYSIVSSQMDCDTFMVSSFDKKDELIKCEYAVHENVHLDKNKFPPIPLEPEGYGTQSKVIRSGEPLILNDYPDIVKNSKTNLYFDKDGNMYEELPDENAPNPKSAIFVPLKLNNEVIGIVMVMSDKNNAYNQENLRILEALAPQVQAAISNALLYEKAQQELNERKKFEKSLIENQKLLKDLVENLPVGVWRTDKNGNIIEGNPAGQEIWGGAKYVGIEKYTEYKGWWHNTGEKINAEEWPLAKAITNGENSLNQIIDIESFDGKKKTILNSAVPFRNHEGEMLGAIVVNQDITEQIQNQTELRNSLREKELLLRELYHRTKNNMQVIISILRLKSKLITEPQTLTILKEFEYNIITMALVHQKLMESKDLSYLNLKEYLNSLLNLYKIGYSDLISRIDFQTEMEDINILIDIASPLGLVFNELISNSIKHAFGNNSEGEIKISLSHSTGGEIILDISDNGSGFPENFDIKKDINWGLDTVIELVENQLQGNIYFRSENGLHCTIVIKQQFYKPRV